jgi:hypothetical protein
MIADVIPEVFIDDAVGSFGGFAECSFEYC